MCFIQYDIVVQRPLSTPASHAIMTYVKYNNRRNDELQRKETTRAVSKDILVNTGNQLVRCLLRPLDPLLPKLLPQHLVLHVDPPNQRHGQPKQVQHPHERRNAARSCRQAPRGLRPGRRAEEHEREAERDGHDGAVAGVADDGVGAVRDELVAVLQRELEGEVAAEGAVAECPAEAAEEDEDPAGGEDRGEGGRDVGAWDGDVEGVAEERGERYGGDRG